MNNNKINKRGNKERNIKQTNKQTNKRYRKKTEKKPQLRFALGGGEKREWGPVKQATKNKKKIAVRVPREDSCSLSLFLFLSPSFPHRPSHRNLLRLSILALSLAVRIAVCVCPVPQFSGVLKKHLSIFRSVSPTPHTKPTKMPSQNEWRFVEIGRVCLIKNGKYANKV